MPGSTQPRILALSHLNHSSHTPLINCRSANPHDSTGMHSSGMALGRLGSGAGAEAGRGPAYNVAQSKCACAQCNCPVVTDLTVCTLVCKSVLLVVGGMAEREVGVELQSHKDLVEGLEGRLMSSAWTASTTVVNWSCTYSYL